jgi:hypothetical protein
MEAVACDLCDVFGIEPQDAACAKMWNRARFGRASHTVSAQAEYSGQFAGAQ